MKVIRESIAVKGSPSVEIALKFTQHGPVIYEEAQRRRAYGLRAEALCKCTRRS